MTHIDRTILRATRVMTWDADRITGRLGFDDERVFWLDLDGNLNAASVTGVRLWRVPFAGPPPRSALQLVRLLVIGDDLVVHHRDDTMRVSRAHGAPLWHTRAVNLGADEHASVVAGEQLVCAGLEQIDGPYYLATLDLSSGAIVRRGPRPVLERYVCAIGDHVVGISAGAHDARGVRISDGETTWTTKLTRPSQLPGFPVGVPGTTPGVSGSTLIFDVTGYGLVAIDAASGEVVWERSVADFGRGDVVVHDGRARVLTSRFYLELDPIGGAVLAEHQFGRKLNALGIAVVRRPACWGRFLFAVGTAGIAFAYDPEQRDLAWHIQIGARTAWPPQVAFDRLWIKDDDGRLHVFELAAG